MSSPLLQIDNLSVRLGARTLLHDLSLSLGPGRILGLVGESGSGKSMTALSVPGLLPEGALRTGRVLLDGRDLAALDERALTAVRGRDVGMIFQEPMTALNPLLGIGEQVAEAVRLHRRVSRRDALGVARAALDRVGLPAARFGLDRHPHELSGGQRQRVAIAMAIALRPRLLIADEPTTALDVTTQAQILDLLRELVREEGCGLLLVTHDLAVVAELADEVAVLQSGRLVEQGAVAAVLGAPQAACTQALVRDSSIRVRPPRPQDAVATPLLEARGIVREYRQGGAWFGRAQRLRAVDEASLSVHVGENVGLVGESGCGKSTLLRALLGLEAPQAGEVWVRGERFAGTARQQQRLRRQIQIVFQDPYGSFDPRWRVEQLVSEPFHLLERPPTPTERRARVEAMLARVGLAPADADRHAHEFSGGQRQRIAIARALITEPAIVVLDEALSALDVTIRGQILALLAQLSDDLGVCYLFVSHDMSVVRAITDRVYVMAQGRLVESGPTAEVFAAPRHAVTRALIDATPDLARALAQRAQESATATTLA